MAHIYNAHYIIRFDFNLEGRGGEGTLDDVYDDHSRFIQHSILMAYL